MNDGSNFLLVFANNDNNNSFYDTFETMGLRVEEFELDAQRDGKPQAYRVAEAPTSDILEYIQAAEKTTRLQRVAKTLGGRIADQTTIVTKRWVNGQVSNFACLMFLNTLAGRSYNDITQYHVFP